MLSNPALNHRIELDFISKFGRYVHHAEDFFVEQEIEFWPVFEAS